MQSPELPLHLLRYHNSDSEPAGTVYLAVQKEKRHQYRLPL